MATPVGQRPSHSFGISYNGWKEAKPLLDSGVDLVTNIMKYNFPPTFIFSWRISCKTLGFISFSSGNQHKDYGHSLLQKETADRPFW